LITNNNGSEYLITPTANYSSTTITTYTSGTNYFVVPNGVTSLEILVVAGGGGVVRIGRWWWSRTSYIQ